MKKLLFVLSALIVLSSCESHDRHTNDNPSLDNMTRSKGKKKNPFAGYKNAGDITGGYTPTGNQLTWTITGIPSGHIIKLTAVVREYTDTNGVVQVMMPQNDFRVVAKTCFCEFTTYTDAFTHPFSYSNLLPGSYLYYVVGAYGDANNTMSSFPYITDSVTINVPVLQ